MTPVWPVLAGFFLMVFAGIVVCGLAFQGAISGVPQAVRHHAGQWLGTAAWAYPTGGVERTRMRLYQAGYRSDDALGVFLLIKFAGAALVFLLFASHSLVGALAAAASFSMLSSRYLDSRIRKRAHRVRTALPAALDLFVLALEAGHSLEHSLVQTAAALKPLYPEFSSEASLCTIEMRAGTSRVAALQRMAERVPDDEVRKLVSVLIDAERFGTSLSTSLRSHCQYLRVRMRQNVQEYARRLSVRLVLPIFFLIFPSILLVTLGPAFLQMRGMFSTLMP